MGGRVGRRDGVNYSSREECGEEEREEGEGREGEGRHSGFAWSLV